MEECKFGASCQDYHTSLQITTENLTGVSGSQDQASRFHKSRTMQWQTITRVPQDVADSTLGNPEDARRDERTSEFGRNKPLSGFLHHGINIPCESSSCRTTTMGVPKVWPLSTIFCICSGSSRPSAVGIIELMGVSESSYIRIRSSNCSALQIQAVPAGEFSERGTILIGY